MAYSKVIYNDRTLIDLTNDTVTANKMLSGITAHKADGEQISGSIRNRGAVNGSIENKSDTYSIPEGYHNGSGVVSIASQERSKIIASNIKSGVSILGVEGDYQGGEDTSDATANASDILNGQTAYVAGEKLTGTMPGRGAVNGVISTVNDAYSIPQGYHNGAGIVAIDTNEQAKIVSSNIKSGVSILGVEGDYQGGEDTSDATANANEILSGRTAYADGQKLTGTMANNGAINGVISNVYDVYSVPQGYHNGLGTVSIDDDEQDKIIPENIKSGVNILGIDGAYEGLNTADATATANEILNGKTAYVNNQKLIGSMPNHGAFNREISVKSDSYTIPAGYHNGLGSISINEVEQAKIIASNIKAGVNILGVTGTHEDGLDTSDADATASDILSNKTAYVNGEKITGSMTNRGAVAYEISSIYDDYTIPAGYHNGYGTVSFDPDEKAKFISENIKSGVYILGVEGTYEGNSLDTSDANANDSQILEGATAYVNGEKVTGTMPYIGAEEIVISSIYSSWNYPFSKSISEGYHDGSGEVRLDYDEEDKLKNPDNIRAGVTILGITGTYTETDYMGATADEILDGRIAFVNGEEIEGTMPNYSHWNLTITNKDDDLEAPPGFYEHGVYGHISDDEAEKIIPSNIRAGVTILGVTGTYTGS